ncbi:MAG: helix-turn-helix domain-containing protein [Chloroflexi bacterium]|nr:helix-turn-helix domain-containing protein [Chloroflexota bacterium]
MDDLDRYVERRRMQDAEFRAAWEEGRAQLDFRKAVIGSRLSAGLSQKQLAEQIGTSQAAVARLEAGTYRPRIETLHRLATALHVTFEVDSAGVRLRPAAA